MDEVTSERPPGTEAISGNWRLGDFGWEPRKKWGDLEFWVNICLLLGMRQKNVSHCSHTPSQELALTNCTYLLYRRKSLHVAAQMDFRVSFPPPLDGYRLYAQNCWYKSWCLHHLLWGMCLLCLPHWHNAHKNSYGPLLEQMHAIFCWQHFLWVLGWVCS